MTKQEFINEVAARTNLSHRDAARAVDAFLDSITDTLKSGGEVSFTGWGKFTTQRRAERQGVNPRNPSQKVTIPAATVPKFRAGSRLKEVVRGGLPRGPASEQADEQGAAWDAEEPDVLNIDSEGEPDEPWKRPSSG